jgi:polysaccharide biosynthesis protein PelF
MRILLVTEGSYPHHRGGVGTWCQQLIAGLDQHRFLVMAVKSPKRLPIVYQRPENVENLLNVPIWKPRPNTRALSKSERALFEEAANKLLSFLEQDLANFAQGLSQLAVLGQERNLWEAFDTPQLWRRLQSLLRVHLPYTPSLAEVALCMNWLRSSLVPLLFIPPKTDVVHATGAGLAGISAWIASSHHGVPLVLTEHGIYLRERHLETTQPFSLRLLRSQLFQAVARLLYFQADRIVGVCEFNRTWQLQLNAPIERTRVIPNGVNPDHFHATKQEQPTVVWLGRIDPLKDLETLLRAFWHVRRVVPNARLKLFGFVPEGNRPYYQTLVRLRESLRLTQAVSFQDQRPVQEALSSGEVVVLSSLSESLPYSLLEAMASSKAIVATRTGGVSEALGNAGRLVNIQEPAALATALIELLSYPEVRERLGKRARYRVLETYTLDRMLDSYERLYDDLSYSVHPKQSAIFITTERPSESPIIVLRDQAA